MYPNKYWLSSVFGVQLSQSEPENEESAMSDAKKSSDPQARRKTYRCTAWFWTVRDIIRKIHERRAKEGKEPPQDRSARIAANWTRGLGLFTLVLVVVAGFQAWLVVQQLDVMRKDQRAWIIPTVKEKKIDDPTFDTRVITITNPGKTPAKDIKSDLFLEVIPNDGTIPRFGGGFSHLIYTAGVVWPNAAAPDALEVWRLERGTKDTQRLPISDAEKTALKEGKAWIAVHGTIEYSDVFGQRHYVRFCDWESFMVTTYLSAKSCSDYNGEGDIKPQKAD
jgi:hypothetical protein